MSGALATTLVFWHLWYFSKEKNRLGHVLGIEPMVFAQYLDNSSLFLVKGLSLK